jgi:hypothetical protein
MGVARLRSGTLKSVTTRHESGLILSEFNLAPTPAPQPPRPQLPEPTVGDIIHNFAGAMAEWFKAGLPVVSKEIAHARLIACRSCPGRHWQEEARAGLGKCTHPKCGCTKGKMWLGTSKCPIGHWPT